MNRRSLLAGILAAGFAPAVVGSGILMPVQRRVILWGDGIHDDTEALQQLLAKGGTIHLPAGTFRTTRTLLLPENWTEVIGAEAGSMIMQDHSGVGMKIDRISASRARIFPESA